VKNELKMEVDEEELPVNPENEEIKIPAKRAYRSRSAGERILIADKYEYGRIVSSGMIGIVYLAREFTKELVSYVCIKRMMGEKMAEKRIFPSISREIKILQKINKIRGCIKMQDLFMDEKSLSLVFPYYLRGDLYTHSKVNP
jgi:serine/threonine protein kinase